MRIAGGLSPIGRRLVAFRDPGAREAPLRSGVATATRMTVLLALLALPPACGGTVRGAAHDGGGDGGDDDQAPASAAEPGGNGLALVDLPECEEGFVPRLEPGRPCHWVVEEYCYDTKREACACACARDRVTTCVSGLGGFDAREPVTCF